MRISVIGGGNVGATCALMIAQQKLGDVVLVDIVEGIPQGKALDMAEAAPVNRYESHILGTNKYEDIAGSDIVVVTAGLPRKPGMTRMDLLQKNAEIVTPAASVVQMVEAIVRDTKRLLPASAYIEGEFGLKDVFAGVPVIIGKNGVEKIVEIELATDEKEAL